jgi:hypothetical protein
MRQLDELFSLIKYINLITSPLGQTRRSQRNTGPVKQLQNIHVVQLREEVASLNNVTKHLKRVQYYQQSEQLISVPRETKYSDIPALRIRISGIPCFLGPLDTSFLAKI